MKELEQLEKKIEQGYEVGYQEALDLIKNHTSDQLRSLADRLRRTYSKDYLDTCSIMNARSGRCPENCKWCSQSVFHKTEIDIYPLVEIKEAVESARYHASKGVRRFSLVTSGRTMSDTDIERSCAIYNQIKRSEDIDISLCASMGLLNKQQLEKLYESGVKRYHCNLESAPSYFPNLCTTHTSQEKIQTIKWAMEVGMEVCSGGIIGMGETMEHRVELAVTLRELGVRSIPVNILNPVKGTALENAPKLDDDEILKTVAIFRIINPKSQIRFAGGRNLIKHLESKMLNGGVSASIVGDMLTTSGSDIDTDKEMFKKEGFTL